MERFESIVSASLRGMEYSNSKLVKPLICFFSAILEFEKKSWIIDCFKENNYPLEIAEIELSNEEENFSLPSFISKEITGVRHYSNFSLSYKPFSKWNDDYLTTFKNY